MEQGELTLKKCAKISLVALGILFIYAILFFKERLLFADTAYVAFQSVNSGHINVIDTRYGAFISKVVPYFSQKLHLPITIILFNYIISYQIFYLLTAFLLVYRYKQYGLSILMSLYYFLFASDSYFMPADIHVAIAWMFLLIGTTTFLGTRNANNFQVISTFMILGFATLTTHFIVIIPVIFLWVYLILEQQHWPFAKNKTIILSSLILVVLIFIFLLSSAKKSYDGNHLHGVTHFSIKDILETFSKPVIQIFLYRSIVNYWITVIVFATGVFALWKNKQTKLLAWTCISVLGYLVLMGLTYGDTDQNVALFHIELEWTSLGIIIAAPFVFSFLPKLRPNNAVILLSFIFLIRLGYISASYPTFHWRIRFEEQILSQMKKKKITKLAMYDDVAVSKKWVLDWAFPFESILMTAMNGDTIQRTFAFINRDEKQTFEDLKNPELIFATFRMMAPSEINKKYFNLDTTKPYVVMEYGDLMK